MNDNNPKHLELQAARERNLRTIPDGEITDLLSVDDTFEIKLRDIEFHHGATYNSRQWHNVLNIGRCEYGVVRLYAEDNKKTVNCSSTNGDKDAQPVMATGRNVMDPLMEFDSILLATRAPLLVDFDEPPDESPCSVSAELHGEYERTKSRSRDPLTSTQTLVMTLVTLKTYAWKRQGEIWRQ